MADTLLFRGGSSADIVGSTVQNRELVIDTDTYQIVSGASKKKTVMEDSSGNIRIDGSAEFLGTGQYLDSTGTTTVLSIRENNGYGELITGSQSNGLRLGASNGNPVEFFVSNNANPYARFDSSGLSIGGTLPSSPNIKLNGSDGSATFVGDVQSGGDANKGNQDGVRLRSVGLLQCSRPSGSSIFAGYTTGVPDATATIGADGSAAFTGSVLIGDTLPSSPKISLNSSDGSATFTGSVGIGTNNPLRPLDVSTSSDRVAIFRSTTATANIELQDSTTVDTIAIGKTGDDLSLYSDNTKRLTVVSGGNVLIGGTLPSAPSISLNADGSIAAGTYNTLTVGLGGGSITTNTSVGRSALTNNTTGTNNTAFGLDALSSNTDGGNNTASGRDALSSNTEGSQNTAFGRQALYSNVTGSSNAALGQKSGYYIEGSNNTVLGAYTGTSADATLNDTVIISAGATERARCDSNGDWDFGSIILKSPDGTSFRLSVANDGTLSATSI